ncbi:hypothetical protein [Paraflavitalea sp. CAU 1676]|uniref:hypothetical protein n=1 Tax=Paraflavitalea sp. CAU 1676 TaxID=3032598 RepID=UPI0023DA0C0B|nr:hypothetical protein [Paraflavitalea sp. CAU 1676]MDF2188520.1 hypothetical protein [Paraflavitalea sp. CAU 1676]
MFSLFNSKKVTIHSLSIPDIGWRKAQDQPDIIQWYNPEETMGLSVNYFNLRPDIPAIKDIHALRQFYRQRIMNAGGGVVEISKLQIQHWEAIRTIFKFRQEPSGIMYLASITIPFKTCSFVVKIQAMEVGHTGMREAIVANKLLSENQGTDIESIWSAAPNDHSYSQEWVMNVSEGSAYDLEFPNHHLSKARALLAQIEKGIVFKKELEKQKPFDR